MTATERANAAAERASVWHQGSNEHALGCAAMAHLHEHGTDEEGKPMKEDDLPAQGATREQHLALAELWAKAAEAEADLLDLWRGDWQMGTRNEDEALVQWEESASGQATDAASVAEQEFDSEFRWQHWF